MDVLTQEQRRRNMQAIRSKGTKMEVALAKAMFALGHRYRKNNTKVFGKPDLTFKRYKIAVFVDSEYFHGRDWDINKHRIKTNKQFWWNKIETNMKRDIEVNLQLKKQGWKILRFWSQEVNKNLRTCTRKIEREIQHRTNGKKVF